MEIKNLVVKYGTAMLELVPEIMLCSVAAIISGSISYKLGIHNDILLFIIVAAAVLAVDWVFATFERKKAEYANTHSTEEQETILIQYRICVELNQLRNIVGTKGVNDFLTKLLQEFEI